MNRLISLDIARTIAVISIVMCHAASHTFKFNLEFSQSVTKITMVAGYVLHDFGYLGVPIFLYLTGYLLLSKEYSNQDYLHFQKMKTLPLYLIYALWVILYNIFCHFASIQRFSTTKTILELLFLKESYTASLWYLPMIISYYLLLPLIANCLQKMDKGTMLKLTILFSIGVFGMNHIAVIINAINIKAKFTMNNGLHVSTFALYMIWGYFCKEQVFEKFKTWKIALIGVVSFFLLIALHMFALSKGRVYWVSYEAPYIFATSLSIFLLCLRTKFREGKIFTLIAYYSFPIYLLHMFFIYLLQPHVLALPTLLATKPLLLWTASFVASIPLAYIIKKWVPYGAQALYLKPISIKKGRE